MKVCLFGTYKASYNRNSSIREALKIAGVEVVEVQREFNDEKMELSEDFTIKSTLWRIARKITAYFYLMSQSKKVMAADYIFVLHPGHLDLPFAWIFSKLAHIPLIFDTSISPYDTMFIGRSIAPRNSLKAITVKHIESFLLKFPDKLIVDTKFMKKFIHNEFNVEDKKIFVVPLGANEQVYKPAKTKPNGKNSKVFFFGLFQPMHGVQYILEAAKILKKEKNIEFTILGDGYLKPHFLEFSQKNSLNNVHFEGFVQEKDLVKYIQNNDIILGVFSQSPIYQRQIPNKVYAALACKKPLICAEYPVLKEEFIHKKHIYYCKVENANSLAIAIKDLAKNKSLQQELSINGYYLYKQKFTPIKIGKTLLKGIES